MQSLPNAMRHGLARLAQSRIFLLVRIFLLEGYVDVTFVDDCAVLIHARSNDRIAQLAQCIIQPFTNAAGKQCFAVNVDPGKTELLWNIVGRGAKKMKEQVF